MNKWCGCDVIALILAALLKGKLYILAAFFIHRLGLAFTASFVLSKTNKGKSFEIAAAKMEIGSQSDTYQKIKTNQTI